MSDNKIFSRMIILSEASVLNKLNYDEYDFVFNQFVDLNNVLLQTQVNTQDYSMFYDYNTSTIDEEHIFELKTTYEKQINIDDVIIKDFKDKTLSKIEDFVNLVNSVLKKQIFIIQKDDEILTTPLT